MQFVAYDGGHDDDGGVSLEVGFSCWCGVIDFFEQGVVEVLDLRVFLAVEHGEPDA